MSVIAGIDVSTFAIDCCFVDEEDGACLALHRWSVRHAVGDAFDRTRWIRHEMPSRSWWIDQGVVAIGIEDPAGKHGVRDVARAQGAALSCLPLSLLVHPLPPARWRKLVGLKGNATKAEVMTYALTIENGLTQDLADALCIATATRTLLEPR